MAGQPVIFPVNYAFHDDRIDQSEELLSLPVIPFAPGEKAHWIEIVAHAITGWRIETTDT